MSQIKTVKLLAQLVQVSSLYPHEEKISQVFSQILGQLGFGVRKQKVAYKRFNILASKGQGKSLLFFGHLDTVGLTSGWKTDPYQLTKKGDRLYGLGAWDMKGGLAAVIAAIEGFDPKGFELKLAFVVDEENYSLGMHTLIKSGWLKDVAGAICPEPSFSSGLKGIALGRIGRCVYKVTLKTAGGHVYQVHSRPNAISESYKVLEALKKFKQISHKNLGNFVIFPRFIKGGANSMSIPGEVVIELETQLVPPQTAVSVLNEIKSVISTTDIQADVTVDSVERPTPFCQPFIISQSNPFVKQVSLVMEKSLGQKPVYYYRRSVADENRIASLGIPVLTIGPGGGNAHEANEWVSQSDLLNLTMFLKKLLTTYNKNN